MSHVFICHSPAEAEYASKLAAQMRRLGFVVWLDESRVERGQWPGANRDALVGSSAIVVLISHAARQSKWVGREIDLALELGKPIFPLLLEGDGPFSELRHLQYHRVPDSDALHDHDSLDELRQMARDLGQPYDDQPGSLLPFSEFYDALWKVVPYNPEHLEQTASDVTGRLAVALSRVKSGGVLHVNADARRVRTIAQSQGGGWVRAEVNFPEMMLREFSRGSIAHKLHVAEELGWELVGDGPDNEAPFFLTEQLLEDEVDALEFARDVVDLYRQVFEISLTDLTVA